MIPINRRKWRHVGSLQGFKTAMAKCWIVFTNLERAQTVPSSSLQMPFTAVESTTGTARSTSGKTRNSRTYVNSLRCVKAAMLMLHCRNGNSPIYTWLRLLHRKYLHSQHATEVRVITLCCAFTQAIQTHPRAPQTLVLHIDSSQLYHALGAIEKRDGWKYEVCTWVKEVSAWNTGPHMRHDQEFYIIAWPEGGKPELSIDDRDQQRCAVWNKNG